MPLDLKSKECNYRYIVNYNLCNWYVKVVLSKFWELHFLPQKQPHTIDYWILFVVKYILFDITKLFQAKQSSLYRKLDEIRQNIFFVLKKLTISILLSVRTSDGKIVILQ